MSWRGTAVAIAAIVAAMLATPSVGGQSAASQQLARAALEEQNNDLRRHFGRKLIDEGRDLEIDPAAGVADVRQTLLRRAALYEQLGDLERAGADLTSAVQLDPPSADAYAARGYFDLRLGRLQEALADFLIGAEISSDNARVRFGAGRAQALLGNYTAALGHYDAAIRLAQRDPTYYLARAQAYLRLDQPRSAWADFDNALGIKLPRVADRYYAFVGRGYASLMMADYTKAIVDFDSALAIDPSAVSALLWRGYAREKGGQVALALDDYERAAALDPSDRLARANLQRLRSN